MFDDIALFVALVEAGSFVQAAKNLKITQATVSRRLQALEERLGVSLANRNTRNFELTKSGRILYQGVKEQKASLLNLIDDLRYNQRKISGRLRVSLPAVISHDIISPYLAEFMQLNPGLELEICYQNRELDLYKENFDLAVVNYRPRQQTILIRKMFEVEASLFCTPSYCERYGVPHSLEELNKQHLVVGNINSDFSTDRLVYATHVEDGDFYYPNHNRFFTNNALHNKQIALSGHAIVGGWDFMYRHELATGTMLHVLPEYKFGHLDFYLLRVNNHDSNVISLFIKFLEECFTRAQELSKTTQLTPSKGY
jgi:DNA-binding transcriptional LysR family regulator